MKRAVALLASVSLALVAIPARAQSPESSEKAANPELTDAQKAEAQKRYENGLDLYDDGNFEGALQELKRAYAIAPNYRLLFNIGVVYVQLKDYVRAVDTFEQYLSEGGSNAEEAKQVEAQLVRLAKRIARVTIKTDLAGADITVDDVPVGKTPFDQPVRLSAGRRKITATVVGRPPVTKLIEIAGGDELAVDLVIPPPIATTTTIVTTAKRAEASKPIPWTAWAITGGLAAGAGTMAFFAFQSSKDYEKALNRLGLTDDERRSKSNRSQALRVAADVVAGAAIVSAGVSLYLTLRPTRTAKPIKVGVTPVARGSMLSVERPW